MDYDYALKELYIDEWIWIIFIVLSLLNIFGDELKKDDVRLGSNNNDYLSRRIFTFTVFVSLIVYIYIANRNYRNLKIVVCQGMDTRLHELRLLGSILVVVGVLLFLYFQLNSSASNNPSIV